jgi:predicted secreted protein
MPRHRTPGLVAPLADARSRRVVLLAHCLLNENVRFLGGATRPGAVLEEVEPYLQGGVGIVQLPCPEQLAWGGVLKRHLLRLYGTRVLRWSAVRRPVVAVARGLTALRYAAPARRTVRLIEDYAAAGVEIVGVVGVGASPSCGVRTTLDLDGAVEAMARCRRGAQTPEIVTRQVVAANVVDGPGLFISDVQRRLARKGIAVPMREHDLLGELARPQPTRPAGSCW